MLNLWNFTSLVVHLWQHLYHLRSSTFLLRIFHLPSYLNVIFQTESRDSDRTRTTQVCQAGPRQVSWMFVKVHISGSLGRLFLQVWASSRAVLGYPQAEHTAVQQLRLTLRVVKGDNISPSHIDMGGLRIKNDYASCENSFGKSALWPWFKCLFNWTSNWFRHFDICETHRLLMRPRQSCKTSQISYNINICYKYLSKAEYLGILKVGFQHFLRAKYIDILQLWSLSCSMHKTQFPHLDPRASFRLTGQHQEYSRKSQRKNERERIHEEEQGDTCDTCPVVTSLWRRTWNLTLKLECICPLYHLGWDHIQRPKIFRHRFCNPPTAKFKWLISFTLPFVDNRQPLQNAMNTLLMCHI